MITIAQIKAAQNNDLDGIRAVLDAMSTRLDRIASGAASRLASNPARHSDYAADFRQDAVVALFEFLPRWEGESVDEFYAYMYASIEATVRTKLHAERNSGVDRDALSVFKAMVERAEGDLFLAEKLSQTIPPKGKRLSADRANAARIAWQGTASIDKQTGDDDEASLMFMLVAPADETPDVIRPKVGRGAASEALNVLARYVTTPRDSEARTELLSALESVDVDTIEAHVIVPRDAAERRYVLDALGVLRSYVSTIADGVLAEDLRDVSDERSDERAAKHGNVSAVLDAMAQTQAEALRYSYGMGGRECFGTGDAGDLDGMAEAMGVTKIQARDARTRGHKAFAKRYVTATASSEQEAQELTEAAAKNLGRGGRK